jgi:Na+-transporting methylmalonyl-CoA/oxaloacetate decarboxylase gamma subunit
MPNPIIQALEITGIGMGLVFLGIFILWGMMALLVRIFREKEEKTEIEEKSEIPAKDLKVNLRKIAAVAVAIAMNKTDLKRRAAAVAVSTVLALGNSTQNEISTAQTSSWLIVNRMNQINLRNQSFTRKTRGN